MVKNNEFVIPVGIELDEAMVKRLQDSIEKELGRLYATLTKQMLAYNQASANGRREMALDIEITNKKISALQKQEIALRSNANAQKEYQKFSRETAAVTRATGLIMQDLAFGFVAIQNNIPMLIEALDRLKKKQLEVGAITQGQYKRFMMLVSVFNAIQAPLTLLMVTNPKLMKDAFEKLNEVITGTSERLTKLSQFRMKDALGETAVQDIRRLRDEIAGLNTELAQLRGQTVARQDVATRLEIEKTRNTLIRPSDLADYLSYIYTPLSGKAQKRLREAFERNYDIINRGIKEFIGKDMQDEAVQEQVRKFLETGTTDPNVKSKAGGLRRGLNAIFNVPFLFEGGANEEEQAMFRNMVEAQRKIEFDRRVEQAKIEVQAQKESLRVEQERAEIEEMRMEQFPARIAAIKREADEKKKILDLELKILKAQQEGAREIGDTALADALGKEISRREGLSKLITDRRDARLQQAYGDRRLELLERRQRLEDALFQLSRQDGKLREGMEAQAYALETEGLAITRERAKLEEKIAELRRLGRTDAAAELEVERARLNVRQANYELSLKAYELERQRIIEAQNKEQARRKRQAEREELNRAKSDLFGRAQANRRALQSQARAIASRATMEGRAISRDEMEIIRGLEVKGLMEERDAVAIAREAEEIRLREMQEQFDRDFNDPTNKKGLGQADYDERMKEIEQQVARINELSSRFNDLTDQISETSRKMQSTIEEAEGLFRSFIERSAMQTSQLIARRIEMVVSGEQALMRKEMELSERRLALQRRQNAKQEQEMMRAYRKQVAVTEELLMTQQITESEALRRRAEANEDFQMQLEALQLQREELALREQELERRKSETLADIIATNVANIAIELGARWALNKAMAASNPFVAAAIILSAAAVAGMLQGVLTGMIRRNGSSGGISGVGGVGGVGGGSQAFGIASVAGGGGGGQPSVPNREQRSNIVVIRDERVHHTQVILKAKDLNLVGEAEERHRQSLSA